MTISKPAPTPVDWARLHARIAEARAKNERLLRPSPSEEAALLQTRGARLARPTTETITTVGDDYLVFTLPGERYAVPTAAVRHVFPAAAPVPIPWAPPLFRGLVNNRGRPLLVVDVGLLLGRPERAEDADVPFVLVLADDDEDLGLAVGSAEHLGRVPDDDISRERLPEGLADVRFLRGVTAARLLVLAVDELLRDPRLSLGLLSPPRDPVSPPPEPHATDDR